jgi:hypothetical protein
VVLCYVNIGYQFKAIAVFLIIKITSVLSVGIVRSRTQTIEFVCFFFVLSEHFMDSVF